MAASKKNKEILKEYVFEDIRAKEFPEYPSRRNCMFLFGLNENINKYLKHFGLDISERIVVKIEIIEQEKKLIKINPKFLNCNFMEVQEIEKQARKYWNQDDINEQFCEYLFRGKFRITEIIDTSEYL